MTHYESDSLGGALGSGHCWAKPARATPKGVIAPILRNDMTLGSKFGKSTQPSGPLCPVLCNVSIIFTFSAWLNIYSSSIHTCTDTEDIETPFGYMTTTPHKFTPS